MGFTFSFDFKPAKQHKPKVKRESPIIEKSVMGVIEIKLDGTHYIAIDGVEYTLAKSCYDIVGKKLIYHKYLYKNKFLKEIRLDSVKVNYKQYLPFRVGNVCVGNLIKEDGITKFAIIKFDNFNPNYIEKSKEAQKYFINNYETIKDLI